MNIEIVASNLPPNEGPVWCDDGSLVVSSIAPGGLIRLLPETGEVEKLVTFPGGANAAQLAWDGGFLIANNGGIDFTPFASVLRIDPELIPYNPGQPSLQHFTREGELITLIGEPLQAPNDLILDGEGAVYFTDPPPNGGVGQQGNVGRLWKFAREGELSLVADQFKYINGIALSPAGRLLVVEDRGLMWINPHDGSREWLIPELPGTSPGDGFAFDRDGNIYCACPMDHCLRILDERGLQTGEIYFGDNAQPTNCCFGGEDLCTLYVTELFPGRVCAVVDMPVPGLAVETGSFPARETR